MRETVLLFNIKDKKRAQELQMICMSLRIRVRLIKKEEYFQTVGVLAGMKEASETDRIYEGEELADEMMVFAGVTGSHLDQILFMMRKKGMKRMISQKNHIFPIDRTNFSGRLPFVKICER